MSKYQALIDALALEPQAWSYDSNKTPFYNDPEGNSRGGNCDGTYCLFGEDFEIDGEAYDGPTLSERCGKADAHYIAAANPATIRALLADLERAEKDAGRYRFLAAHCRSTSEHWGGRWSIVVEGTAPKTHDSEDDFDAAIDAALAQMAGGG